MKRPLLWILAAYLTGMYLAGLKLSIVWLVMLMLFIFLVVYLLMYRLRNTCINSKDIFLWFLPVLLLFGFLAWSEQTKKPELYDEFEQKIECELSGTIYMIVEKQSGYVFYMKNNTIVLPHNRYFYSERVIVLNNYSYSQADHACLDNYRIGNRVTVSGTLLKFSVPTNPGQFNESLYYQIEKIDFKMNADYMKVIDSRYSRYHAGLLRLKQKLKDVYESILSKEEAGILKAMLLGEKYMLEEDIKQLYQKNGIAHILAISGLHISMIGMVVYRFLKRCKLPDYVAVSISICFIYSYGVMTNYSISTNRAVVMMTILLLAPLFGKTYDMLSATAVSALIILLQNPLQILSAGFLLSFSAVLGIAVILPCFKRMITIQNSVIDSILICISVQIAIFPVILYFYYQFPAYSILTNLIILPLITVLLLVSILAGFAGLIYLPIGLFLIGGADVILKLYKLVCRIGSSLPGNMITVGRPGLFQICFYIVLILIFLWTARTYRKRNCFLIPVLAILVLIVPTQSSGLNVIFLDVGQGDAIYMEHKNGATYLIDGGSSDVKRVGTYRLKPFLLSRGKGKLDFVIITHSDEDHISGIVELIQQEDIIINHLVLPKIPEQDEAYVRLEELAYNRGIHIKYINAGDIIKDGAMTMFCLHPSPGQRMVSSNDYSTVLSVTYHEFDLLLTGDLPAEGESRVMELLQDHELWAEEKNRPAIDYDILKVAHHGSKYSTTAGFLALIRPEKSIISCGYNNHYGHPHRELLDRLSDIGCDTSITSQKGAVIISTDGYRMKIETYLD